MSAAEGQTKTFADISVRTGLKVSTIKDLFDVGWIYVESLNGTSRWEDPSSKLKPGLRDHSGI